VYRYKVQSVDSKKEKTRDIYKRVLCLMPYGLQLVRVRSIYICKKYKFNTNDGITKQVML
jgi:hypothetical protein